MNCKPGDLALVVSGLYNVGKMVQCIELVGNIYKGHLVPKDWDLRPIWIVDKDMEWRDKRNGKISLFNLCPDKQLMPIRPDDMKDEELENVDESIHV